jgi:hypothetical protein
MRAQVFNSVPLDGIVESSPIGQVISALLSWG